MKLHHQVSTCWSITAAYPILHWRAEEERAGLLFHHPHRSTPCTRPKFLPSYIWWCFFKFASPDFINYSTQAPKSLYSSTVSTSFLFINDSNPSFQMSRVIDLTLHLHHQCPLQHPFCTTHWFASTALSLSAVHLGMCEQMHWDDRLPWSSTKLVSANDTKSVARHNGTYWRLHQMCGGIERRILIQM